MKNIKQEVEEKIKTDIRSGEISSRRIVCSVRELKELAGTAMMPYAFYKSFFIALAGGALRSSKEIAYDKDNNLFTIFNDIDGSQQTLTPRQLFTRSNIGEAIKKGCLIAE